MQDLHDTARIRSLLELEGLGKEIWAGVDPEVYIGGERTAWSSDDDDASGGPGVSTAKEEVRKLLDSIPDDASYEDIQYHIYVREKIERALKEADAGRFVTEEEVQRRLSRWLEE